MKISLNNAPDWILRLGRKKSTVDKVASTVEGQVFLRWIREDVCKAHVDPMDSDGNPFKTANNIGMQNVWRIIERELRLDVEEVVHNAIRFEDDAVTVERAYQRLGIHEQENAA